MSKRPWVPSYDRRKKPWRYANASDVEDTFHFAMKMICFWLFACISVFLFIDVLI